MIKEIIEAGGTGFIVPAVLFVLVLYAIRGIFGLHGRRSQHRKEFLDLWDSARSQDDLWLEVAVRHLFGTYLPARVIRLALAQPDKSQALFDLSELWPMLRFDPDLQTVSWLHKRNRSRRQWKVRRYLFLAGYFTFPLLAVLSALIAFHAAPASFVAWTYGFCAVLLLPLAFVCLERENAMRVAAAVGETWVKRINRHSNAKK